MNLPKTPILSHQVEPASKPFLCIICEKTFPTEDKWVLHKCTAPSTKGSRFGTAREVEKCDVCLKPFKFHSALIRHIAIHTEQRLFACHLCSKTFRQSTHLDTHQLTHMEEKPFKCGLCRKSFKVQRSLVKHRQVHARKARDPKLAHKGRGTMGALTSHPIVIDDTVFHDDDVFKPCDQYAGPLCHVYGKIPHQCPVCMQKFETQQILEMHTCFIDEYGQGSNPGRMTS